jgi:hypothetical protein
VCGGGAWLNIDQCKRKLTLLTFLSRSKRQPKDLGWANAWVVGVALLLAVPFAAAQTVAAWMSVLVPGQDWERKEDVGRFFLASFVDGTPELCDNSDGKM